MGRYCIGVTPLERWESRYAAGERGGRKPSPLVIQAMDFGGAPGRALDLACGAGRNALLLAKNGWDVTAVDGSPTAIQVVQRRAKRLGVEIDARVIDLVTDAPLPFPDQAFDLVSVILFLHRPLYAEVKRVVRAGGIIAAAAHMTDVEAPPMNPDFLLEAGELETYFAGCEILFAREGSPRDDAHKRAVAELIARR